MNAPIKRLPPFALEAALHGDTTSDAGRLAQAWIGTADPLSDTAFWNRFVEGRRQRDHLWQVPAIAEERAWVCSLRNIETVTEKLVARRDDVEAAISFIEEARRGRGHDRAIPYGRPSVSEVVLRRAKHEHCERVRDGLLREFAPGDLEDRDQLLSVVGDNPLWYAVRRAVNDAFVLSVRSIDPTIEWKSPTWRIQSALDRVCRERGFHRFRPDVAYVKNHL